MEYELCLCGRSGVPPILLLFWRELSGTEWGVCCGQLINFLNPKLEHHPNVRSFSWADLFIYVFGQPYKGGTMELHFLNMVCKLSLLKIRKYIKSEFFWECWYLAVRKVIYFGDCDPDFPFWNEQTLNLYLGPRLCGWPMEPHGTH